VSETVPPPGAEDPDDWRAELLGRYPTVSGFLKLPPSVISFGATAEGAPVLTYETVSLAGSDQGVEPLQTPPARRPP